MAKKRKKAFAPSPETSPMSGSLRQCAWTRFLRGPDPALLEALYIPALGEAIRYDRCCSYFSSTVLAAAARGFGGLIERLWRLGDSAPRPAVCLIVNEELSEEDVRAMTETGNFKHLEVLLQRRFKNPSDLLEKKRLAMLGWLVKENLLELRVGVMRRGGGIVHAKFGIVTDAVGDAIVFSGSGNESAQGLRGNYERLEVSTSWEDPERHREYVQEFDNLWRDRHPDVHTLTLPEALRLKLIRFAPKTAPTMEPTNALTRQKAAMIWQFIVEAPYLENGGAVCDATAMVDLWPHQRKVVAETAEAWPEGRLLCDEVGMGKTIEAILVLRRLMAGRGVKRCLILLPACLLKQWQGELREKGGMIFPRLEGTTQLIWPDDRSQKLGGLSEALQQDVLLMSRETARMEGNVPILLQADPWDLVILDESHAARRRKQEEGEYNSGTLLLDLMRKLQLSRRARGFMLLSATPMQTHPWEPWDLLAVLGVGGPWLAHFASVRDFYEALAVLRNGACGMEMARRAARVIAADDRFPTFPDFEGLMDEPRLAKKLAFVPPSQRVQIVEWLRRGSPLARRMHRNTRTTLKSYYQRGLLSEPPPQRAIDDRIYDFEDAAERRVYVMISDYIQRRYDELEMEKTGKGFVMTVYRRRATSSWFALEQSLKRRRDGLRRVADRKAFDFDLASTEVPEALNEDDLPEVEGGGKISAAFPQDPQAARNELGELERVSEQLQFLRGRDTKRDRFFDILRQVTNDGRSVLIFTEYRDTLDYLRDNLAAHYGKSLGCYSGAGGERWTGEGWQSVTKDAITRALANKEISVLICTDAASEGLNLQAAGAVINYDLPWNPSKVEQRIGRIDRIGQKLSVVRVVNLFLRDSVDDRVYRALRERCGLFEHFVGPMQPVLAQARLMLLGQEGVDLDVLHAVAGRVDHDPLAGETYVESPVEPIEIEPYPFTRAQMKQTLCQMKGELGPHVKEDKRTAAIRLLGLFRPGVAFSDIVGVLERERTVLPLTPLDPKFRALAESLTRPGENLPLVIGTFQKTAFRRSMAYWVGGSEPVPICSFEQLEELIKSWDGFYPDPAKWIRSKESAQKAAENQVRSMEQEALRKEQRGIEQQVLAARLRLQQELGRYLICLDPDGQDLNGLLYSQMNRDIASAHRLRRCLDMLGGYPDWPPEIFRELSSFARQLTDNQCKARLLGREVDAALEDPRWGAVKSG